MKLTLIHPCVGRFEGMKYLRAWQMEPLPMAQLAALTPSDVAISFFDDRMEPIPFDQPTDLVAISVETYTAKRAYQIASEYRKRKVTVVMGGFHATLCPEEVMQYADAIVCGPAEPVWEQLILDFQHHQLKRTYTGTHHFSNLEVIPDRSIYTKKNYLKLNLLEAGRGCRFTCEFCSIQKFFEGKHCYKPIPTLLQEINQLKSNKRLFFFVDDNITANHQQVKELFKEITPLGIKWVGQADITITRDEELLQWMVKSGCQGVLIGFESLNPTNLKLMNKGFNQAGMSIEEAIRKIHRAGIIVYGTFLHGYDGDVLTDYQQILQFCMDSKLFMVGFNHVTPFPSTGLYERLEQENRLLYDAWWLDERYHYGDIPFKTQIAVDQIENECRQNRKKFYSLASICKRMGNRTNIKNGTIFLFYVLINNMLRKDAGQRASIPMGDQSFKGELLKVTSNNVF